MRSTTVIWVTGMLLMMFTAAKSGDIHQKKPKKKLYNMNLVEGNLWVDDAEISNLVYLEFLFHQSKGEKDALMPDTSLLFQLDSAFAKYYFNHPAFRNYPVVGVSYEQAQAFCEWRTWYYCQHHEDSVVYRLPTKDEWERIAVLGELGGSYSGTYTDPYQPQTKKEQRYFRKHGVCAINSGGTASRSNMDDGYLFTNPVNGTLSSSGFYGLAGNVAEMVEEKSIAKGGDWFHSLENCTPQAQLEYTVPAHWLGFRCVAEVK